MENYISLTTALVPVVISDLQTAAVGSPATQVMSHREQDKVPRKTGKISYVLRSAAVIEAIGRLQTVAICLRYSRR